MNHIAHTWTTGDVIPADQLNTLEQDLAAAAVVSDIGDPGTPTGSALRSAYVAQIPGVVPDGATDNTATILNWCAANLPNGGIARLPLGVIAVNALAVPQGVTLVGSGATNTSSDSTPYGTRLVPATTGQNCVVLLSANQSGLADLDVDALRGYDTNVAQCAVRIVGTACSASNVGMYGGSLHTLFGDGSAIQFIADHLYIRTGDFIDPVSASGLDWQVSNSVINGPGSCFLNGSNSYWSNVHFVSNQGNDPGFPAFIRDQGGQFFSNCYFDGTAGTAFVDRTYAYSPSSYYNCEVLQSVYDVTGIPIFKEATDANSGVTVNGLVGMGRASTSTFTNVVDAPLLTTRLSNVTLPSGWLTGNMLGQPAPAGCNANFRSNIVNGTMQSADGLLSLAQYGPAGSNVYQTTTTTPTVVDATNFAPTIIAPPTGRVFVKMTAMVGNSGSGASMFWGVAVGVGSTTPAGPGLSQVAGSTGVFERVTGDFLLTGLTPGASVKLTWVFSNQTAATTATIYVQSGTAGFQSGPATMEVWAA